MRTFKLSLHSRQLWSLTALAYHTWCDFCEEIQEPAWRVHSEMTGEAGGGDMFLTVCDKCWGNIYLYKYEIFIENDGGLIELPWKKPNK